MKGVTYNQIEVYEEEQSFMDLRPADVDRHEQLQQR